MGYFSFLYLPSTTLFPRPGVPPLLLNILLIFKVCLRQGVILGAGLLRFS